MSQDQNPYAMPEPHVSEFNRPIVEEFRANGGRVGGPFEGGDLLLLTTVGAGSSRLHTTPLGYVRDGDRLLVVGSAGGAPRHPDWYHNLLAHPMAKVEVGTQRFDAVGVPAVGIERERLFERVVAAAPGYADYQARVERRLPVVVLQPTHSEAAPGEVTTLADKLVEIHTWLREQLRHVRAHTEAHFAARTARHGAADPPPAGLDLQIRQHCLAFCQSLQFHHHGEDTTMLPHLRRAYPHLTDTIQRLLAEHRTVARIQESLADLLADVRTADPDRFRSELDAMSRELEAHLDFEEDALIPVLAAVPFPPPAPGVPPSTEATP